MQRVYVRQLMALPFLPEGEISPMFEQLRAQAATDQLKQFAEYIAETWINSITWPPSCWSVFQMVVRTNNGIEGWHKGLHRRASGKWSMPFYLLLDLLHQGWRLYEFVWSQKKKLKRIQRAKYCSLRAKIFEHWDDFSNGKNTSEQLLKCAYIIWPVTSIRSTLQLTGHWKRKNVFEVFWLFIIYCAAI